MDDIRNILAPGTVILTLALIFYAYRALPRKPATLLSGAIIGFSQYAIAYIPHSFLNTWIRHAPVYVGLVLLFMFVNSFAKSARREPRAPGALYVVAPVAAIISGGTILHWLQLMTDEGLQHLTTLPLFGALLISSLLRSAESETGTVQRPLRWFIAGGFFVAIIHVMEFLVKSQELIPALDGTPVNILELVWLYVALACLTLGIRSGRKLAAAQATS